MAEHLLDNPLWSSLTSLHRELAIGTGNALRYPAEVAPFLATAAHGESIAGDVLAPLVAEGETVFLIGPAPAVPHGWRLDHLGELVQMVCERVLEDPGASPIVPLDDQRAAVVELAALVYPHYFRPRTPELGRYFGLFEHGLLAAMIGERMGMPGLREISAVCTHPDFTGRGLARRLLAYLGNDLRARGTTPFLHVSPSNERAQSIYERSGYRARRTIAFWSLTRA